MKQPLVSVIIPTYNRAKQIYYCINSILKQDYKNLEVIVIDDGSIDETKEVISAVNDERAFYHRVKHGGPSAARNDGIKRAKGKYITFCDDDDLYLQGKIRIQVKYLEENQEYAFCYTNGIINEEGKRKVFLPRLSQNSYLNLLMNNSQILTPSVMIRAAVIKKFKGFNEQISFCEDYDLWLRIAKKHKFNYLNNQLVLIQKHESNISSANDKLFLSGTAIKLRNLRVNENMIPNNLRNHLRWSLYYQKGKYFFFHNNLKKSRTYFLKSFFIKPFSFRPIIFLVFSYLSVDHFYKFFIPLYKKTTSRKYEIGWETLS